MWPTTFEKRLESWTQLRAYATSADIDSALHAINTWWHQTPWQAYYLHWDDQLSWPDPWQLLNDNVYCGLARALGILYTITMIDRTDLQDARLVEIDSDNLVLVSQEKYILNWSQDTVLNTNQAANIRRTLQQHQIKQQYN
jgi:hypothetical protein